MTSLDPRPAYPTHAMVGEDSAGLLDEAVHALVILRAPMHHGDAGADLHALASLIAEANSRIPRVVADARDQLHTWTEIANQLGVSRLVALARYWGRTARWRTPLDPD
jgi:hypothetical protein